MARKKKPQRVIVRNVCLAYPRATLIEKIDATQTPSWWSWAPKLARVVFDFGLECYVPAGKPRKIKTPDLYETAIKDAPGFFQDLLAREPVERGRYMAHIAVPSGTSRGYDLPGGISTSLWSRSPRYFALLRRLPDGVDTALQLVEGWLADEASYDGVHPWGEGLTHYDAGEYKWAGSAGFRYGHVVDETICALALLLSERSFLAEGDAHVTDGEAARIQTVVETCQGLRLNSGATSYSALDYLTHAAAGNPILTFPEMHERSYAQPATTFGVDSLLKVIYN